jgi:hypothetical protein
MSGICPYLVRFSERALRQDPATATLPIRLDPRGRAIVVRGTVDTPEQRRKVLGRLRAQGLDVLFIDQLTVRQGVAS